MNEAYRYIRRAAHQSIARVTCRGSQDEIDGDLDDDESCVIACADLDSDGAQTSAVLVCVGAAS